VPGHHFFTVNQTPEILLFAGRLHPLLVHLPIGMLIVVTLLEVIAWLPRYKNANASAGYILLIAAPLTVVTVICGWLLSLGGGYDESTLAWHKWLGIVTAFGTLAAAVFYRIGKRAAYHVSLFATFAVLGATGHLGGSLTHGSDYLTRYAPGFVKKILGVADDKKPVAAAAVKNFQQLPVFAGVILPVMERTCINCHGAQKAKSALRLDTYSAVMKGSENGAVVKAGTAATSALVQRLLLPSDSDDHMPPVGKPQPTADEIVLLKWWIDAGAPETKTITELQPTGDMLQILARHFDIPSALP